MNVSKYYILTIYMLGIYSYVVCFRTHILNQDEIWHVEKIMKIILLWPAMTLIIIIRLPTLFNTSVTTTANNSYAFRFRRSRTNHHNIRLNYFNSSLSLQQYLLYVFVTQYLLNLFFHLASAVPAQDHRYGTAQVALSSHQRRINHGPMVGFLIIAVWYLNNSFDAA